MAFTRRNIPLMFMFNVKKQPVINQAKKIHRWVLPTLRAFTGIKKQNLVKNGPQKPKPRNTFLEWNLEAELYAFGHRVNEKFDPDLLLEAFTDHSYVVKEQIKQKQINIDVKLKDNRNLAQKGEKFMKEYIQKYLEFALPKLPMQGIVGIREHLTSETILAHISSHLGTKDIILADDYPVDDYTLANTFKAIVGALLASSGELQAAYFVRDIVITQLQGKDLMEYWQIEDPWSMLTSIINKPGSEIEPRLIGETGKNTLLACYQVGIYLHKKMISSSFGESVAVAKEMAAREALRKFFGTEDNMYPIDFKIEGLPNESSEKRYLISST